VENKKKTWRGFLKDLVPELVRPHMNERLTILECWAGPKPVLGDVERRKFSPIPRIEH
jgi:hypothetical protein